MKKIAVCVSGLIKNYNNDIFLKSLNSLNQEYDVFWHTWDYCNVSLVRIDAIKILIQENDKNAFNNLDISLNKFIKIDQNSPPENIIRMFYSMMQCTKLMENYEQQNNIKYDLVIRIRPDIIFNLNQTSKDVQSFQKSTLHIPSLNIEDNKIIMPLKGFWVGKSMNLPQIGHIRVSDAFFIGNESVRKLSKTYNDLSTLQNKYNMPCHPEQLIAYSCFDKEININLQGFECDLKRN
jgi:hypothetical protein